MLRKEKLKQKKLHGYVKYIVFAMLVSVVLFISGILFFPIHGVGEFGTLLAGTIGVGASISAMIAVIATLKEQQKVNNQKDLLVAFNSTFKRFSELLKDQFENRPIKDYLNEIWEKEGGIEKNLDILNHNWIDENTYKSILTLKKYAEDPCLKKVGKLLDELFIIKKNAGNESSYSIYQIMHKCNEIDSDWIKYASFYLKWNIAEEENSEIEERIDTCIKKLNDIPIVKVDPKEISPFEEETDSPFMNVTSENFFSLQIFRIDLHFRSEKQSFTNTCSLQIGTDRDKYFTFNELFGDKTIDIVNFIHGKVEISGEFDLCMKHNNEEWIYKGELLFYKQDDCKYLKFKELDNKNNDL